jgi:hypothetical protein
VRPLQPCAARGRAAGEPGASRAAALPAAEAAPTAPAALHALAAARLAAWRAQNPGAAGFRVVAREEANVAGLEGGALVAHVAAATLAGRRFALVAVAAGGAARPAGALAGAALQWCGPGRRHERRARRPSLAAGRPGPACRTASWAGMLRRMFRRLGAAPAPAAAPHPQCPCLSPARSGREPAGRPSRLRAAAAGAPLARCLTRAGAPGRRGCAAPGGAGGWHQPPPGWHTLPPVSHPAGAPWPGALCLVAPGAPAKFAVRIS